MARHRPPAPAQPSGLVSIVTSIGEAYRSLLDPVKPAIDKIVDPIAIFVAGNVGLATGMYYARQGVSSLFGDGAEQALEDFSTSHSTLDAGIKLAAYGTAFAAANLKLFFPWMARAFRRTAVPSWKNHFKTVALAGGMVYVLSSPGFSDDLERMRLAGTEVSSVSDKIRAGTDEWHLDLDGYSPLARVQDGVDDGMAAVSGAMEHLESFGFQTSIDDVMEDFLDKPLERVSPPPGFSYGDKVSQDASKLQLQGIQVTPEELAYLARIVYLEGAGDPAANGDQQRLLRGLEAIASVLHNRWKYDNAHEKRYGRRPFSLKQGTTLYDVAFMHTIKKNNGNRKVTWQFSCIGDRARYFYPNTGKAGWDLYEGGRINVAVGGMNPDWAAMSYQALINVLSGSVKDPTMGALFYQNKATSSQRNKDWGPKRGMKKTVKINSHDFYRLHPKHYKRSGLNYLKL